MRSSCDGWRWTRVAVILALSCLSAGKLQADVAESQRDEVRHLLEFVRDGHCSVERNGTRYTGKDAYSHIMKKYDYFRDRIETSEDFIELSATKSTMSDQYYRVFCDGIPPMRTKDWLLEELNEFRKP